MAYKTSCEPRHHPFKDNAVRCRSSDYSSHSSPNQPFLAKRPFFYIMSHETTRSEILGRNVDAHRRYVATDTARRADGCAGTGMARRGRIIAGKLAYAGSQPGTNLRHSCCALRYCRSRLLEIRIAQFELEWTRTEGGLERLDKLLAASERETRAMMACARALRLTPQSPDAPEDCGAGISNLPQGPRPWET